MRLYCNAYRLRAGAKLGALEEFVREDVRGGMGARGSGARSRRGQRGGGTASCANSSILCAKAFYRNASRVKAATLCAKGGGAPLHHAPLIFTLARNPEDL